MGNPDTTKPPITTGTDRLTKALILFTIVLVIATILATCATARSSRLTAELLERQLALVVSCETTTDKKIIEELGVSGLDSMTPGTPLVTFVYIFNPTDSPIYNRVFKIEADDPENRKEIRTMNAFNEGKGEVEKEGNSALRVKYIRENKLLRVLVCGNTFGGEWDFKKKPAVRLYEISDASSR